MKLLKTLLAMTLIFQPMIASTVSVVQAQQMEQIEEPEDYDNHNEETLESLLSSSLEEDEVLTESEETDEEEKPPQQESEDESNEVNESSEEEEMDSTHEKENDEESEDSENDEMDEEDESALEDFLWQGRFLIVDEEGALVKIEEAMARSNGTLIHANNGVRIPNTAFDFRSFNWVDPNNSWNLWHASGLPRLQLRIGNQLFTVFCIEPAVPPRNGHDYMISLTPNGMAQTKLSAAQRNMIELILLYGYGSSFIQANQRTSDDAYVATQALIWSVVANTPNATGNEAMSEWNRADGASEMYRQFIQTRTNGNTMNNITSNTRSTIYRQIKNDVRNHGIRPSFTGTTRNNAPTHALSRSGNNFTVTLTDTRGVLSRYFTETTANVGDFVLQRNDNRLTINMSVENARRMTGSTFLFDGDTHAPFRKEFSGARELSWATNPNSQDLVFGGIADSVPAFMNVSVPIRTVTIRHVRKSNGAVIQTETPRFGNNENWLDGDTVRSTPRDSIMQGSTPLFPIDSREVVRTINGGNVTITHYYEEARTVTVQHRIQGTTTDLIPSETLTPPTDSGTNGRWFDGMTVTSSPRTDLRHNGRGTRPVNNNPITRTIDGNITIIHYYETALTVTVRHENQRNGELLREPYNIEPENGYWFNGMNIGNRSTPRTFYRTMPDGTQRIWEHHSSTNVDAVINGDMTVTHRYRQPLQITVQHVDEETGRMIQTEVINDYFSGDEGIKVCPQNDLKTEDGYIYISVDSCHHVDLSTEDVTVTFNYVVPSLTVNVDRIEITTGQKELPTELRLSRSTTHEEHLGEISYRVRITHLETGTVTQTPEREWQDFQTNEKLNLPTDGMDAGEEASFQIEVVFTANSSPNQVLTISQELQTKGFRSSEKVLNNQDFLNGKVSYTAPARTIATRSGDTMEVEVLNETLEFEFTALQRQKTGYGVLTSLNPIFRSEISEVPEIEIDLNVQESLVDSFIYGQFQPKEGVITIPLEEMSQETTNQRTNYQFEFPQIHVQRGGGELFTNEQVQNNHDEIQNELIDGGRYFYIPAWHDLGKYEFVYTSNQVGRNLIRFNMVQTLDVYAFMFAWMGSPTLDEDELLLIPVFPDTATPEGWTTDQIEWLRGQD